MAAGYSPATLDIYRWALSRVVQHLGDPEVASIAPAHLLEFLGWLRHDYHDGELAPASIENAWKAIRSFYNWAEDALHTTERPDRKLPRPRYTSPEIVPFSHDEIKLLLHACDYTKPSVGKRSAFQMRRPTATRDRAIVLVLLDTGLRISELARLQVCDINRTTGDVMVRPYGTGQKTKSRIVHLGTHAFAATWRCLGSRVDGCLFTTERTHEPMDRHSLRHLLDGLGKRAGVRNVHPHRFRHTFAIQYLRNGGDIFTLQRLLGHASLTMVRRYLSIADADVTEAHRRASPVDRWNL